MKVVKRETRMDSTENREIEYLIDNIMYTTDFDTYSLPKEVVDYLSKIDFDALNEKIVTMKRCRQEYQGFIVERPEGPPENKEQYYPEEGVWLATNVVSEDACSEKGYKLFLLAGNRMGVFSFSEQSGSSGAGVMSGSTMDWSDYTSRLEKLVRINKHWVCIPVEGQEQP